jgi:hypothetical protein
MAQRLVGVTDEASGAGVVDIRARERTVIEQCVIPERCREAAGQTRNRRPRSREARARGGARFPAAGAVTAVQRVYPDPLRQAIGPGDHVSFLGEGPEVQVGEPR